MNCRYRIILLFLIIPLVLLSNVHFLGSPAMAQSDPNSYLIGPDDTLSIYVWKEPDLTQDIIVLPDGKVTFPLVGEIQAEGLTVTELKNSITERLKDYVTAPEVTVVVRGVNSRRIYTLGKVNSPGPYPLAPGMTVIQALSAAGGLADWADEKSILVIRREGGKEIQHRFNYKEYLSGDNLKQNIFLKPNDTILVP
jgi:polysaccharide export outer membrane protein